MEIIEGSVKMLDMSDEDYFGNALPGYISNSKMGLINPEQGGSDEKWFAGFEDKKTDSLALGSAIHALILEPEKYSLSEVVAPTETERAIITTAHKMTVREKGAIEYDEAIELAVKYHNWYSGKPGAKRIEKLKETGTEYFNFLNHNNDSEISLPAAMRAKAIQAVGVLSDNPKVREKLYPAHSPIQDVLQLNEKVFIAKVKHRGVIYDMKLKADNVNVFTGRFNNAEINDLKTTSADITTFMGYETLALTNPSIDDDNVWGFQLGRIFNQGAFQKWHYYRQMYMYRAIVAQWLLENYGIGLEEITTNMVVVETRNFKPRADVFTVSEEWMEIGRQEFNYLMDKIHDLTNSSKISSELEDLESEIEDLETNEIDLSFIEEV